MTKYNPEIHHRKTIRLKGYDYSGPGVYFITIVTHNWKCLLGNIVNGKTLLNEYGWLVHNAWLKTEKIRSNIIVDEFIVMPNHIHGVIIIENDNVGAYCHTPNAIRPMVGAYSHTPLPQFHSPSKTIGSIVRGFKSFTTKQINQIRQTIGISLWQRNYYEHIIRNENELNKIREYIINNPLKWELDFENPDR